MMKFRNSNVWCNQDPYPRTLTEVAGKADWGGLHSLICIFNESAQRRKSYIMEGGKTHTHTIFEGRNMNIQIIWYSDPQRQQSLVPARPSGGVSRLGGDVMQRGISTPWTSQSETAWCGNTKLMQTTLQSSVDTWLQVGLTPFLRFKAGLHPHESLPSSWDPDKTDWRGKLSYFFGNNSRTRRQKSLKRLLTSHAMKDMDFNGTSGTFKGVNLRICVCLC